MTNKNELKSRHDEKVKENLLQRLRIQDRCSYDLEFRAICIERSRQDLIWWVNHFVVTYNPRVKPSLIPLVLFPRQEECIKWILDNYKEGKFCTIAKSRYTGASWIATCILAHKLLFEKDFIGTFASNKEDNVDKLGDSDTLFSKVVMLIERLPTWFHSIDLEKDRKLKLIINPSNNSSIVGKSGRSIGRGGRSSLVFVDEFAFVQYDAETLSALSENTECAVFISTPCGTKNKFYELCQNPNIPTFYYRWDADPRRTLEWRKEQTLRFGERITAQELDIDFNASNGESYIDPKWVLACINAHVKIPEMTKAQYPSQCGLDVAGFGSDKSVAVFRQGSVVTQVVELPQNYPTQTALILNEILEKEGTEILCFDADGLGLDIAGALFNLEKPVNYLIIEFHGAGKPSNAPLQGIEKLASDVFANKRVEAWAGLQRRIKNTYEHLNNIQSHDVDDLISIPDVPEIILDLSKPSTKYRGCKLLLESKEEMRKRGLESPDYGDALSYCFYDDGLSNHYLIKGWG